MKKLPRSLWSYLLVVAVAVFSVWLVDHQADVEAEDDRIAACEERNETNEAIVGLIEAASSPSGAAAIGLTSLPSYDKLDPATQRYLADLQAALADVQDAPGVQEALDDYADGLQPEVCRG